MSDVKETTPKMAKAAAKSNGEAAKEPRAPTQRKTDPELVAMARLSRELDKVTNPVQRERIVRWLTDKYAARSGLFGSLGDQDGD